MERRSKINNESKKAIKNKMNIFKNALIKEKLNKLPLEYIVVRKGKNIKIKTKEIYLVEINSNKYSFSGKSIMFKNFIEFQLFIYENFYKIDKIFCNKLNSNSIFYLRNGLLHNDIGPAYIKYNNYFKEIDKGFYLKGKQVNENVIKINLRLNKLKKISI